MVTHYLVADLEKLGLWDEEMLERLKYLDGNVGQIPEVPDEMKKKYLEAFDVDPIWALKLSAARGKWIDQSQSHNVFVKGTSGKLLSQIYISAWKMGLKTTYYLRTLAASQIEKSTLDASKYGFTQKREYAAVETEGAAAAPAPVAAAAGATLADGSSNLGDTQEMTVEPALCRIEDPECESCQ